MDINLHLPLAFVLIFTLAGTPLAFAQSDQVVIETAVDYQYGGSIDFYAGIKSEADVARATVFFRPFGSSRTEVLEAELSVLKITRAVAVQDLRAVPLPPFAPVEYWWQVDFTDGSVEKTAPAVFEYTDNRFSWKANAQPPLTVHWVEGDLAFGQAALDIAYEAFDRSHRELLLPGPPKLDVYIYPTASDLEAGLRLGGQTRVQGHAEPSLGVVLVVASSTPEGRLDLERSLPHEITHVLLYHRMGDQYDNLPLWLSEGLSTLQEQAPDPEYRLALEEAAEADRLLPFETLCSAAPFSGEQARLAYAQSASMVRYLNDIYGVGATAALLDTYHEPVSCLGGIERVFRRSPAQLETEWRRYTFGRSGSSADLRRFAPWLLLTAPIPILFVAMLIPLLRKVIRSP